MAGRGGRCGGCCSRKFWVVVMLLSAIAIAYVIRSETKRPNDYEYYSHGWMRECAKWDNANGRFLVSFFDGGIGQVAIPSDEGSPRVVTLEEVQVVKDADLAGNATLGFTIDAPRNRVVVTIADVLGNRYSAVAAYDLTTWNRLFLTRLSGPGDEKTFADDVAVDEEGNAYVTDTRGSKIWRVGADGRVMNTIAHPLFTPKDWYHRIVQLNGIVYHPNRYLLVIHTFSGNLYKVEISNSVEDGVKLVRIAAPGSLRFGDGLALLSPTQVVVAGNPSKLVESSDDWATARVVGTAKGLTHRLVTAALVKDGKPYLNHMFGYGYPKRKHILAEAVFN